MDRGQNGAPTEDAGGNGGGGEDDELRAVRLGSNDRAAFRDYRPRSELSEYGEFGEGDSAERACSRCSRKRPRSEEDGDGDGDNAFDDESVSDEDEDAYRDDEENMPDDGPPRFRRTRRPPRDDARNVGEAAASAASEANHAYMRDPQRLNVSRSTAAQNGDGDGDADGEPRFVRVSLDEAHRRVVGHQSQTQEDIMNDIRHQIHQKMEEVREDARRGGHVMAPDRRVENQAANEVARLMQSSGVQAPEASVAASESHSDSGDVVDYANSFPGVDDMDNDVLLREADEFAEKMKDDMNVMNVHPSQLKSILCPLCYLNIETCQRIDSGTWTTIEGMCFGGIGNLPKDTHAMIVAFMYNTKVYSRLRGTEGAVPPLTFSWAKSHIYDTNDKHRIVRRSEIYNDVEVLNKKIAVLKSNLFMQNTGDDIVSVKPRESHDLNKSIELKHKLLAAKQDYEPFVNQGLAASMHQGGPLNGFASVRHRKRSRFS